MPKLPAPYHPLHLIAGQAIWLMWFGLVYAGMSVGCTVAPPSTVAGAIHLINLVLLLVTALTVALLGWAAWCSWSAATGPLPDGEARARVRFVTRAAAALYAGSAIAVLATGVPLAQLPPCV